MTWRPETTQRINQRVRELIENFDGCCDSFDGANLFTGPSAYFHSKTLALLRQHASVRDAILNDSFLDSVYSTLTAWGMHRMGPGNTKIVDFPVFVESVRSLQQPILELSSHTLLGLKPDDVESVSKQLWAVIAELKIGPGSTKIVAGSKVLHHLLPELVPPIDRQYTIRFFFHHKSMNQGDQIAFREMYPRFCEIANRCSEKIGVRLGRGMNTSTSKVIDNAIVGFVLTRLKPEGRVIEED
jgi:hypothetical protein